MEPAATAKLMTDKGTRMCFPVLADHNSELRYRTNDGIGLAPQSHCDYDLTALDSGEMGSGSYVLSQSLSMLASHL
jgi:hypothetical protein